MHSGAVVSNRDPVEGEMVEDGWMDRIFRHSGLVHFQGSKFGSFLAYYAQRSRIHSSKWTEFCLFLYLLS